MFLVPLLGERLRHDIGAHICRRNIIVCNEAFFCFLADEVKLYIDMFH